MHLFIQKYSENLHLKIKQDIIQKCVIINRSSIGLIITPTPSKNPPIKTNRKTLKKKGKKCRVTRLDISMQKEGSILLSHTGLKHYYKTDKKEFEIIENKYLSKKWIDADFETKIKELAHNIRNKSNNQKIMRENNFNINQGQLFESMF